MVCAHIIIFFFAASLLFSVDSVSLSALAAWLDSLVINHFLAQGHHRMLFMAR